MRNPLNPRGPYRKRPIAERFWEKVARTDECWDWIGSTNEHGYGLFHSEARTKLAHRVAWILTNGSIPDGESVLHRCDNPPCVRPDHLWLGSKADNSADMAAKWRAGRAKLTAEDIRIIRSSTDSQRTLARRFGVTKPAIALIRRGRTYRHVS